MRGLSIKQPWMYCITDLDKRVENRTWKPPLIAIGTRIALHASKRTTKMEYEASSQIVGKSLEVINLHSPFTLGAIVATAKLDGYVIVHDCGVERMGDTEYYNPLSDKWFYGPVGWVLSDIRKVLPSPVYCQGTLGLWKVPPEILAQLDLG